METVLKISEWKLEVVAAALCPSSPPMSLPGPPCWPPALGLLSVSPSLCLFPPRSGCLSSLLLAVLAALILDTHTPISAPHVLHQERCLQPPEPMRWKVVCGFHDMEFPLEPLCEFNIFNYRRERGEKTNKQTSEFIFLFDLVEARASFQPHNLLSIQEENT